MQQHFNTTYKTLVKASLQSTWNALTNPQLVEQYFFGSKLTTNWQVGSTIYFSGEWEGKPYRDKGIIQEYTANKSLSFTYLSDWSGLPDTPENYLLITYAVEPTSEGTSLTISQTNYDAEKAEHSKANWAQVIDGMKKLIE